MGVSVGVHLLAAALLVALARSTRVEEPEPVRLVFVEPAPGTVSGGLEGGLRESRPEAAAAEPPGVPPALVAPPPKSAPPPAPVPAKPKKPPPEPRRIDRPRATPGRPHATGGGSDSKQAEITQPGPEARGVPGGRGDGAYPAGAIPSPPVVIGREVPAYPAEARRRQVEGVVLLEAIVDRDGRVEPDSVKVLESVALLDTAAVEAVRRWRFRPGRDRSGAAVRVILEIPIRFALR
jgi:protein TonB